MKVECYSVRVSEMYLISPKAYKVVSFDGSSDIIPASCVYGPDLEVIKSDAYWIASWVLRQKKIQYSSKKVAWFDKDTKRKLPTYTIEKHQPEAIDAVENNEISQLKR